MKKIITVIVFVTGILLENNSNAQVKIGYISIENMISIMPETGKIDSILERYQGDSLNTMYSELVKTYQYKDSLYRDCLKTPALVRKQIEGELPSLIYQIQNWQDISNQAMQAKQNLLLQPIYIKVYDAIKLVAKEKGYTHVLNKEAILVAPDGDDLIKLVAAKLKVPIPSNPNR